LAVTLTITVRINLDRDPGRTSAVTCGEPVGSATAFHRTGSIVIDRSFRLSINQQKRYPGDQINWHRNQIVPTL
jgi:hypothetical protein